MNEKEKIGFIGLGVLGSAIAQNLLENGFPVIGFDVVADKLAAAQALGMEPAASPRAVAEAVDVVITCLPTVEALRSVIGGEDGIDKASRPGQIVVETSTFPVKEKEAARDHLAAAGKVMLDCPVSGNRIMALQGKLTSFGSGERAVWERVDPIIRGYTRASHYVGDFGCGMKTKICGNILNLVHNSIAAEVITLAVKSGLDPKVFHEVISGSGSSSAMFEVRGKLMVDNEYMVEGMNFSIPLKDSKIIAGHAAEMLCPTPIYHAALQNYYAAVAQGHYEEDQSAVCAAMERAANCERKKGD